MEVTVLRLSFREGLGEGRRVQLAVKGWWGGGIKKNNRIQKIPNMVNLHQDAQEAASAPSRVFRRKTASRKGKKWDIREKQRCRRMD